MSLAKSIVFVVDDDASVRESLESMIACAGWSPETFASAQTFLARPRSLVPSCLVLDRCGPVPDETIRRSSRVGSELGISEITVTTHRGRAMQKMKADSLAALVNMGAGLGLARAATG